MTDSEIQTASFDMATAAINSAPPSWPGRLIGNLHAAIALTIQSEAAADEPTPEERLVRAIEEHEDEPEEGHCEHNEPAEDCLLCYRQRMRRAEIAHEMDRETQDGDRGLL